MKTHRQEPNFNCARSPRIQDHKNPRPLQTEAQRLTMQKVFDFSPAPWDEKLNYRKYCLKPCFEGNFLDWLPAALTKYEKTLQCKNHWEANQNNKKIEEDQSNFIENLGLEGPQKLLGGVLGPFWLPRVLPGRKILQKWLRLPSPTDQFGGKNWHFADLLLLFCDLFLDKRWGRLPDRIFIDFW